MDEHKQCWLVCKKLPTDFKPYGEVEREAPDCSCGCKFFKSLEGKISYDWGVCVNPESPRSGLLTFEHQGCSKFEEDNTQGDYDGY